MIGLGSYNCYTNGIEKRNELIESLELLEYTSKLYCFKDTAFIILFSGKDLFDKKINRYKISFFDYFIKDYFKYLIQRKKNDEKYKYIQNIQNMGKSTELPIPFNKMQEFNSEYCIDFLKQLFHSVLPKNIQKNSGFYTCCAVG